MILFLYNLLFPFAFIFFIPGMIIKYIRRGGEKDNYSERFARFAEEKREQLKAYRGGIWVHAVSVGETVIAMAMIERWLKEDPDQKFILSTTTTTGQALAKSKAPECVAVIFCPIDFIFFVRKTIKILQPELLIIFETEIWPNMICEIRRSGAELALVNARISDKSSNGYRRFSCFFGPILRKLSLLCVQTELDAERFKAVEPSLTPEICGNMKFDQKVSADFADINIKAYFGEDKHCIILAASTHPGEEELIASVFKKLQTEKKELKLIIVPRHAERGGEIAGKLKAGGFQFVRRSVAGEGREEVIGDRLSVVGGGEEVVGDRLSVVGGGEEVVGDRLSVVGGGVGADPCICSSSSEQSPNPQITKSPNVYDVLLADTTGEMLAFMNAADIVVMGKSLAGHNEGHNVIEPALLGKPVITGSELRNFRYTLKALQDDDAIITVSTDDELEKELKDLIDNPDKCNSLGERAKSAIEKHKGATERTIELCRKLLK